MLRQWEQLDMREQIVHHKTLSIHWICSELNVEFTARHFKGWFDPTGTLGCLGQILLRGPNSFMGTTVWKFCNWDPRHNHNVQPLITRRSSRRHFKFISCFYVLELRWCHIKLATCTGILLQTTDLDGYLQGQSVFFRISLRFFFQGTGTQEPICISGERQREREREHELDTYRMNCSHPGVDWHRILNFQLNSH